MLIAFTFKNFKSIRDLQTLSLEARSDDHLEWSNVIIDNKLRLVKSCAIYGPNASGKSNILEAMRWFRNFIIESSKDSQAGESIDIEPFALSTTTEHAPSHFEIEFRQNGFKYRYGFEVTTTIIKSEWLYRKSPKAKEAKLFVRTGKEFDVSSINFKEGNGLVEKTRPNALFLSVCAQFNGSESGSILQWMGRFRSVSGLTESAFFTFTADRLQDPVHRNHLLQLAQKADFNIQSLSSEIGEVSEPKFPPSFPAELKKAILAEKLVVKTADIKTIHRKLDADNNVAGEVEFDLEMNESSGTQKFVALSGPILHTLEEGSILIVDELEARLHPRLTQALVDLFHSPANRKNAQLIFATHDIPLLDSDRFRRDQIWFCEKDETGATELFTMADFDSSLVRFNSKFSRQYMMGIFGAVPHLAHFQDAAINATE